MDSGRLDLTFPHRYEVELEVELPPCPGNEKVFYFPEEPYRGGRSGGLLVRIVPDAGQPWIGMFAGEGEGVDKVLSTPDEHRVCVVSEGAGYMVCADAPTRWERVQCGPILDVRPIPERQLLVFADFCRLVAYGREGVAWTVKQFHGDDLRITHVSPEHIKGLAYDVTRGRVVEFVLETQTGLPAAGSSP
jgi:hypothetical protein